ncbi:hypothetical protein BGW36DRAFT_441038 [Talaromyces proteolyticus]|uniref:Arrestin-like N-terminal domain-containing protein n=1 Tax=Talaromyces proteolyticus TaxID=1131652 RepID=A0AAD4KEP7_9EURO|nr:uncharacterized protein BGW36DRAFT_441038 [Talaromyces proteolyticus]KAH8690165.1 hypothetical protein BGW36DRAFT_441038 [Talaromyces proteolyticus]
MSEALRIILRNKKNRRYVAGDRIQGYVLLDTDEYIESGTVTRISFTGCTYTKYQSRAGSKSYTGDTIFFHKSKNLYKFPFGIAGGMYKWHFEFTFPSQSRATFEVNADDILPPSLCLLEHDNSRTGSLAKVEYKLEASLEYPEWALYHSPNLSSTLPLIYVPSYDSPEPYYRYWLKEQKFYGPSPRFSSYKDPPTFRARLTFPTVYVHGQLLPVYLSIAYTDIQRYQPKCEVWIDRKKHEFQTETQAMRVYALTKHPLPISHTFHNLTQDESWRHMKGDGLPPVEGLCIGDYASDGLKVPSHICPDVKMSDIAITHTLKIKANLSFCNRQFTLSKQGEFQILPPMSRKGNSPPRFVRPQSPDIVPSFAIADVQPPPYTKDP